MPLPLDFVETDVARVGVAEEPFQRHIIKVIVHVNAVGDVFQVLRIFAGGEVLDLGDHILVFLVAAIGDLVAGFQDIHMVGLAEG